MKDLSAKLWYDVGSVEVASADELKSGSPFTPILSAALRAIMVETIRGCADRVNHAGYHEMFNTLADEVAKTRFHLLYPDLKENTDADANGIR